MLKQGCYWHRCDCKADNLKNASQEEIDKRHDLDKKKLEYLQKLGYRVIVKKECEWKHQKTIDPSIMTQVQRAMKFKYQGEAWKKQLGTEPKKDILRLVKTGELFGLLKISIEIQDEKLLRRCQEFPPFFKHVEISRADIGPHMQEFANQTDTLKKPQKALVSSLFAKEWWCASPLLQFYLNLGCTVTEIHEVVQWTPIRCFERFVNNIVNARREADKDPLKKIIGEQEKLTGNSAPGRSLMRTDRFVTTTVVSKDVAQRAVNNPHFKDYCQLDNNLFELRMRHKFVQARMPSQIGLMVYGWAKRFLLEMYYDFIDKYISRGRFGLVLCDTDSLYFGLGASSLREAVNPDLRLQFDLELPKWMPTDLCKDHYDERQRRRERGEEGTEDVFGPLPYCCYQSFAHQRRTLGLWKVECQSDAIVALAAKAYNCYNVTQPENPEEDDNLTFETVKLSCKGVQKCNPMTANAYRSVLHSTKSHYAVNRGIRLSHLKQMCTYKQQKKSLSYLYVKRQVLDDGVSTIPLKL